jgi:hypothetical protein
MIGVLALMIRDITTNNVWKSSKRIPKIVDAVPGQNQNLPESTEITLPSTTRNFKKFISL